MSPFYHFSINCKDFIQSIGWSLTLYHLFKGSVTCGTVGNIQGVLINAGDVASALWSMVIAVHTFITLACTRTWRLWIIHKSRYGKIRYFLCAGIWGFVFVISAIGFVVAKPGQPFCMLFKTPPLTLVTPVVNAAWIWISENYKPARIGFHYCKFILSRD